MSSDDAGPRGPHRARSVAGLTVVSAISALSPLLALPLVTRAAGPDDFAALATGQAIGTLAATLIAFGWNIAGPVSAARAARPQEIFGASLFARLLNGAVVLPLVVALCLLAAWPAGLLAATAGVAFALQGFTITWYAVGTESPRLALVFDTVPRLIANLAGGLLAFALSTPLLYPLVILAVSAASVIAGAVHVRSRTTWSTRVAWRDARASYRTQRHPALTTALLTFSETSPMSALALASSPAVVGFAPFDRVLKYGYIGVYMIVNSFQGWVSSATGAGALRRMRLAVGAHVILAALLAVAFALVAPWAAPIVLGPGFEIAPLTALFGGVALGAMTLTSVLGLCVLLPSGASRAYLVTVAIGAVLIVPAVLGGAAASGVTGAAAGVAAVQLIVLVGMAAASLRHLLPRT